MALSVQARMGMSHVFRIDRSRAPYPSLANEIPKMKFPLRILIMLNQLAPIYRNREKAYPDRV